MNEELSRPLPVAIIGIGCMFPQADDLRGYWSNILNRVDAITEVPPTHWRPEDYFDRDPKAADRTYAVRGGFLSPVQFPPLEFGITPNSLEATDTAQLLGLLVARQALESAGYGAAKNFDRSRVSVVLGVTGTLELVIPLGARLGHPIWRKALREAGVDVAVAEDVVRRIADSYVGWQEDSFPGLLGNVVAGRIANRLDLGGTNCVVDAACASSLGALHLAMLELSAGRCDMALSGGIDTFNDIFMYMCFSKTPALSATGDARPFAAAADGTILGEGLGCLVLKRLADAERDGDRVFAVIRGVGSSSDGKGQAIYAPSPAGQVKALRQAYRLAGVTPDTIELVEAHGTGTKAGDAAEVAALTEVYGPAGQGSWCALGSVKSQIGHTKAAAGAAGLIKTALALYHKVLPPTVKVEQPIAALAPGRGPFYVNTEKRPWLPQPGHPRRAAVSSFGFGGSNFHCVLEEYGSAKKEIDWDGRVQIAAFSADNVGELRAAVTAWCVDRSWDETCREAARSRAAFRGEHACRLVLVLEKGQDFSRLLAHIKALWDRQSEQTSWSSPEGVYFGSGPAAGKLGMIFPGQGSQFVGMLRDLACQFPQVQQTLAEADTCFEGGKRLSDLIFPQPVFSDEDRQRSEEALRATDVAQPALGAVSLGALRVLEHFGVRPQAVAGHSYGELTALCAAGRITPAELHELSRVRGRLMAEGSGDRGAMLAVQAALDTIQAVLRDAGLDLVVANRNAPNQSVLAGSSAEIARAAEKFAAQGIDSRMLPVAAAFHSRFVAAVRERFQEALQRVEFRAGSVPVFANTTGREYPPDSQQARRLLAGQLAEPVVFVAEIEAMYRAGVRTFLEVGPGHKLTGLIKAILHDQPHEALALDASTGRRSGTLDLARVLGQLLALGYPVQVARWEEETVSPMSPGDKKPALTVSLCGANYMAPRNKSASDAHPKSNGTSSNGHYTPAPGIASQSGSPVVNPTSDRTPLVPAAQPADHTRLDESLRVTQDSLIALQKLSEQTAQLHRQFLDGQDRALQVFQTLLEQQQTLLQAGLGHVLSVPVGRSPSPLVGEGRGGGAENGPSPLPPTRTLPHKGGGEKTTPAGSSSALSLPTQRAPVVDKKTTPPAVAPSLQPVQGKSAPPAATTNGQTSTILLGVVAEKTGYPPEMLDLDMELDTDLGIDSIKRVEIFATLQEQLPHAPPVKSEHMGTLRTLRHVLEFLGTPSNGSPVQRSEPAPPVLVSQPASAEANASAAERLLLTVVAEKTGYPPEMLGLDMELDADLGIDSIKRVEIFATLQERMPEAPVVKSEHMGTLRTLRQVVEFLDNGRAAQAPALANPSEVAAGCHGFGTPNPCEGPAGTGSEYRTRGTRHEPLRRLVLAAVDLEQGRQTVAVSAADEIWITQDDAELAAAVSRRLQSLGHRPRLVSPGQLTTLDPPARLAGLLILASVRGSEGFLQRAFRLLQIAGPALRRCGREGAAVLITVSRLDGLFGLAGLGGSADPLTGGLAGLAKTAAHEWPEVCCKAVDLAPDVEDAAEALAAEMFLAGPVEVGLSRRGPCTLRLTEVPLPPPDDAPLLARGEVVVLTGGARGVTAEAAVALAQAFAPTLVLLGRSPAPSREPEWLAPLTGEAEIKRVLASNLNGNAAPRQVGEEYRLIAANRELRSNLQRIARAGAKVVYRQVDVRDEGAVRAALTDLRSRLGPVKGLVHGAGVLADRRIEDKTESQFQSVYATKVEGLHHLLAALPGDDLKLLALFSSSTARFGRAGQADYAVANEVLNKMARREAHLRPGCRVVSLNWGPWDGGMVTPGLKKVFQDEGIGLIPLDAGGAFLVREISQSADRAVEVVVLSAVASGEWRVASEERRDGSPGDAMGASASSLATRHSPLATAFERELDVERFPVLKSHVLNGRAVLPMALIVEWLAHAALHGHPGLVFHGLEELRICKGVILDGDRACGLRVLAGKAVQRDACYTVPVELRSLQGRDVLHARAEIVLASALPPAPEPTGAVPTQPYPHGPAAVYSQLLFHGPDLQGIRHVEGCSEQGITAAVASAPPPSAWIKQPLRQAWLADPLVLDSAFQAMILWTFARHGAAGLPCFLGRYRQYRRSFPRDGVRVAARVTQDGPNRALADIDLLDRQGAVIAQVHGYECVIDRALNEAFRRNRLAHEVAPSL